MDSIVSELVAENKFIVDALDYCYYYYYYYYYCYTSNTLGLRYVAIPRIPGSRLITSS